MKLKFHNEVTIPTDNKLLKGQLLIPLDAKSIIVFLMEVAAAGSAGVTGKWQNTSMKII